MNDNDSNNNDLNYKLYLDERKWLMDARLKSTLAFDRSILVLLGGAFALSLTIITRVFPNIKFGTKWILICAWILFYLCLLSNLISFLTSQSACSKQIKIVEKELLGTSNIQSLKNKPALWTNALNIISIITFILGVISLAIFSILNL